jgi:GMP synthase-like glutamine amidotransferase
MKLHYFQHEPFEGLGMIADWALRHGHSLGYTAFFQPDALIPNPKDYDALIVMGGSMGVYDEDRFAWLAPEKAHIRKAIDAGKPVLGICLGAQLIAASLGAQVAPHTHKEIGWFPVAMTDVGVSHPLLAGFNSTMTVFHWHGDRFEIPNGAYHLMTSAACDNQAFAYGDNVLALQFHLEMDPVAVRAIMAACAEELRREGPGLWVQSAGEIVEKSAKAVTKQTLFTLLDRWSRWEET